MWFFASPPVMRLSCKCALGPPFTTNLMADLGNLRKNLRQTLDELDISKSSTNLGHIIALGTELRGQTSDELRINVGKSYEFANQAPQTIARH